MPDETVRPWHHFAPEFRASLNAGDRAAFNASLAEALGGDHVLRGDGLLIDGNAHGRSYNAMGQSDMGLFLVRAGLRWDEPAFLQGGLAAMEVMLTDYDAGGLGLLDAGTGTAWYCGKTSREATDRGGTLNKHLYATRSFLQVADALEGAGETDLARHYKAAGVAGFRKLVLGEQGPQLADYFVDGRGEDAFLFSWVYYGSKDASSEGGYFLNEGSKNAYYHIYDMELIHQVAQMLPEGTDLRPFFEPTIGGLTPFGAMLRIYNNKLALGGLDTGTPVPLGEFAAAPPANGRDALSPEVANWFAAFLPEVVLRGGAGADALMGGAAGETLLGRRGDDDLRGRAGGDMLLGGGGEDTLAGGRGDDVLSGGRGDDILVGGAGADIFWFKQARQGTDTIADFEPGRDLLVIGPLNGAGTGASVFLGDAPFTNRAGELRFAENRLALDRDGDGAADLEILLPGVEALAADDVFF